MCSRDLFHNDPCIDGPTVPDCNWGQHNICALSQGTAILKADENHKLSFIKPVSCCDLCEVQGVVFGFFHSIFNFVNAVVSTGIWENDAVHLKFEPVLGYVIFKDSEMFKFCKFNKLQPLWGLQASVCN